MFTELVPVIRNEGCVPRGSATEDTVMTQLCTHLVVCLEVQGPWHTARVRPDYTLARNPLKRPQIHDADLDSIDLLLFLF